MRPGVVVQTFDASTREAEVGTSLGVRGQLSLRSTLQASQGCIVRHCLLKRKMVNQT